MRGVYRQNAASSVAVGKFHEVMNNDEPALVDNLLEDTHQHYAKKLMSGPSALPTSQPSMSRASQLLGIGALLGDDSDDEGTAPPAKVPKCLPSPADPAPHMAANADAVPDEGRSLLEQIRPQQPAAPVPKAKGKAKAKGAPKGKAAAAKSASSGSFGKIRPPVPAFSENVPKGDGVKEDQPPVKKLRVSPIESMDPSHTGSMAAHMQEADKQWQENTKTEFADLLNFNPREPENEFKADVAELQKRLGSLLSAVRAKMRSGKRRSEENQATLMSHGTVMVDNCTYLGDFLKALTKGDGVPGSGDSLHSQFQSFVEQKAIFGVEVVKRVAKRLLFDDICCQRWVKITKTTWPFIHGNMPPADRENFFFQQITVQLQKLLKGIDNNKASLRFLIYCSR